MNNIGEFVKNKRKKANLTQPELAERAGVGLRFIRELESNKETLRLDKVDQVLKLFGHTLGPVPIKREDD
jgi:y4mF family transcriptional regulator